jgi:hypothetical protein
MVPFKKKKTLAIACVASFLLFAAAVTSAWSKASHAEQKNKELSQRLLVEETRQVSLCWYVLELIHLQCKVLIPSLRIHPSRVS